MEGPTEIPAPARQSKAEVPVGHKLGDYKWARAAYGATLVLLCALAISSLIMPLPKYSALLSLLTSSVLGRSLSSRQDSAPPTVEIQNGTVQGVYQPTYNQDLFLGIPYAEPPLGDLRFRYPQPVQQKWNGTLEATSYYPECVGYGGDQIGYEVSEDCLVINIVRPSGMEDQNLPVGAWIHGGGFVVLRQSWETVCANCDQVVYGWCIGQEIQPQLHRAEQRRHWEAYHRLVDGLPSLSLGIP
jgi:hypothetical protein